MGLERQDKVSLACWAEGSKSPPGTRDELNCHRTVCPQGQGSLVPGLALPGHVVLDAALTVALERKSLAVWGVGLLGKGSSQRGRRMPLVSAFAETSHHCLSDLAVVHAGKWRLTAHLIHHEGKVMAVLAGPLPTLGE